MTPGAKPRWTDRKIEVVVGHILRVGVVVSAIVALAGGILYFAENGGRTPAFQVFRGVPGCALREGHLFAGILGLRGDCVIMLGLLLLIATPVARVLFSAVAFALEGDRTYVLITLVVLAILLLSLFSGVLS